MNPFPVSENEGKTESNRGILKLYHAGVEKDHLEYGDLCVATDCEDVHIQTYRYMAALQFYRKEFAMKNEIKKGCESIASCDIYPHATDGTSICGGGYVDGGKPDYY